MNEQNKYRSDWYVIQTIKGQEGKMVGYAEALMEVSEEGAM